MAQTVVQPKLVICHVTEWSAASIVLEHLSNAPEPPTFTMRKLDDGKVAIWLSKRTFDWLKGVLELDPRAH